MKKNIAWYGMLIALAFVLSYIEQCLPLDIGIPGVKLGLANLVTLVALYRMKPGDAAVILAVRILLCGLLFSNGFAIVYSMAGGIASLLVMLFVKKLRVFSVVGVSVAGGIAHNFGQLLVAALVVENSRLLYYFPVLLAAGTICGALIGIAGGIFLRRLPAEIPGLFVLCLVCGCVLSGCGRAADAPMEKTGFAMDTFVTRNIYGADPEDADEAVMAAITETENRISWRKPDSEVARINANAGKKKPVTVSDSLAGWLGTIRQFADDHPDTVSPLMGPAIDLWDFDQESPRIPGKKEAERAVSDCAADNMEISGNRVMLRKKQNKLDLGAYGKGIACDEAKRALEKRGADAAMISMGSSSILTYGTKPDHTPWKIGIQHPRKEQGTFLGILTVEGTRFLSTSGDYERYVEWNGKRYHHILDPRTGYPAESGLCSVTVIGDSGLLCDALSTACMIVGKERGMKLLEQYGAEGIFVGTDGSITEKLGDYASFQPEA